VLLLNLADAQHRGQRHHKITTIISVIRSLQLTASCGFVGVKLGHGGKS
jgi:hypothetical protein